MIEFFGKKNELNIINKLESIHKQKFPLRYMNIYYTSFKKCPYNTLNNSFWMQINEYDKNPDFLSMVNNS